MTADSTIVQERHQQLRRFAQPFYNLPGVKSTARRVVQIALQQTPITLRNKQRLYNFFARDLSPNGTLSCTVEVPGHGSLKLDLDMRDDLSRLWYFWGYGNYEIGTIKLLLRLLHSKSCILDIGANVGYYALLSASILEGRGQVHAFEPWSVVFNALSRNAKLNRFNSLHLNQMALSDRDGYDRLFLPKNEAWTNASLIRGFTDQVEQRNVEIARIDTYCLQNSVPRIDLVRIDVEGAEVRVLNGMGKLLDRYLPDIICEVLAPFQDELDTFFSDKPYRKFLITDNGLKEVNNLTADPYFRDYYLSCSPVSL